MSFKEKRFYLDPSQQSCVATASQCNGPWLQTETGNIRFYCCLLGTGTHARGCVLMTDLTLMNPGWRHFGAPLGLLSTSRKGAEFYHMNQRATFQPHPVHSSCFLIKICIFLLATQLSVKMQTGHNQENVWANLGDENSRAVLPPDTVVSNSQKSGIL